LRLISARRAAMVAAVSVSGSAYSEMRPGREGGVARASFPVAPEGARLGRGFMVGR